MRWLFYSGSLWLSAMLALPATAQEVYRWVDSSGNVFYGDTEPMDTTSERVDMTSPDEDGIALIEAAPTPPPRIPVVHTQSSSSEVLGPCSRAREQLTLLHAKVPVYLGKDGVWYTSQDGASSSNSWLADASRPNAIASARNNVLSRCSSPEAVAAELRREG